MGAWGCLGRGRASKGTPVEVARPAPREEVDSLGLGVERGADAIAVRWSLSSAVAGEGRSGELPSVETEEPRV